VSIPVGCECGQEFETSDENAGRLARCPVCGRELIVPKPAPPPETFFINSGFNVLFADGSVRFLKGSINPSVLGAILTRNGNETISQDGF
jgi:prepilin-type processing-associated H-X9-DG protein